MMCILGLFTACSNQDSSTESQNAAMTESEVREDSSTFSDESVDENSVEMEGAEGERESVEAGEVTQSDRKIIYHANLNIEVKNVDQAISDIHARASNAGGYIVESITQGETENETASGQITARIPQEHFQDFIQFVEEGSSKVMESSVSGQDVTEEYIDLESRLKSKRAVEERLLSFMEQAEETEDLLAISNDLANVQEDIEEIIGRMNYLEDKSDLATVTIYLQENNVTLSGMSEDDLNTWEKTKQQFLKSLNFLVKAFSGMFVFFIGNLPILILLSLIAFVIYYFIRKRKKED